LRETGKKNKKNFVGVRDTVDWSINTSVPYDCAIPGLLSIPKFRMLLQQGNSGSMEQRREGRTARHGHAETSFSDALFRRRAFFLGPDHSAHAYKYGVLLVCSSNTPPPCDGTWLQQGS